MMHIQYDDGSMIIKAVTPIIVVEFNVLSKQAISLDLTSVQLWTLKYAIQYGDFKS